MFGVESLQIPNRARGTKTSALKHQRLLPVLRAFSRRHLLWARASQVPIRLTGLSEICCDSVYSVYDAERHLRRKWVDSIKLHICIIFYPVSRQALSSHSVQVRSCIVKMRQDQPSNGTGVPTLSRRKALG